MAPVLEDIGDYVLDDKDDNLPGEDYIEREDQ